MTTVVNKINFFISILENVIDSKEWNLIGKLSQSKWIKDKWTPQILAVILNIAEMDPSLNWISPNILGPLNGQSLIEELHKQLSNSCQEIRYWILTCLTKIYPDVSNAFSLKKF